MTNLADSISQAAADANTQSAVPLDASQLFHTTTAIAPAQPNQVAVAGTAMSMDDGVGEAQAVEYFLKLGADCITVDGVMYEKLVGHLVMSDIAQGGGIQKFIGLNYSKNKVACYSKTYDGVTTAKGENTGGHWNDNIAEVNRIDPSNKGVFVGYDVNLTVAQDIQPMKAGQAVLKAGTILGFSTTPTGSNLITIAYKKAKAENKLGQTAIVEIVGIASENAAKLKYNKLGFKVLGYVEDQIED